MKEEFGLRQHANALDDLATACANLDFEALILEAAPHLEAGLTLAEAKDISQEESESIYQAVLALIGQGRYEDALPVALMLAAHEPFDSRFSSLVGMCAQSLGDTDSAAVLYALSLQARRDPKVVFHLGECLVSLGNNDQARQCFEFIPALCEDDVGQEELIELAREAAFSFS